MEKRNLLLKLQRKYQEGGYALVVPKTGKVLAFSLDLEDLYTTIDKGKIKDADKLVMYILPPKVKHVFHLSFTDNNITPLLLGKESIFDKFNVIFDNDRELTIFEERQTQ